MKKLFIFIISLISMFNVGHSQNAYNWQWAYKNQQRQYFGGYHEPTTMVDRNGNLYFTGYFVDSMSVFNQTVIDSAHHSSRAFLIKSDSSNNISWVISDSFNHFYYNTMDDNGTLYSIEPSLNHVFKYSSLGSLKSTFPIYLQGYTSSTDRINPLSLTIDRYDNIYFSFYFWGDSMKIGNHIYDSNTGTFYLIKYDSSANIRWVKQTPNYRIDKLTADNKGNIYAACVNDYDTVQTNPLVVASGFGNDMLVMKIDSGGVIRWATPCGSSAFFDEWNAITCVHDKIYFAGEFGGNYIKLGNDSLYSPAYAPFFVGRIDTAGHVLWGKGAIGTGTPYDAASGVAADTLGRVYIGGSLTSSTLQFDSSHQINNYGSFIVSYDSSGNVLWDKAVNASSITSVSCSSNGRAVYVTGANGYHFGNTTIYSPNSYIAKLSPDSCVVTPPTVSYSRLSFCQGDTLHLGYSGTGNHAVWSNGVAGNTLVVKDSLKAWVTVTQANGCTVSSPYVQAAVHPMPDTTLLANPSTHDLCKGSTLVLSVAVPGNTFQWNNGAQTQAITIDTTGNYSVILSSPYGCVDTSHSYSVIQRPIPTAPDSIALHGGRLYAYPSGAYIYNWYRNGTSIYLSTTNECAPLILVDGQSFTATIVSQYGCESAPSPVYVYHDSSIGMNSITRNEESIIIYPNPANTNLTIRQLGNEAIKYIEIENVVGQVVFHSLITSSANLLIDIHDYPSGIYFIKATDVNGKISNVKFVKE